MFFYVPYSVKILAYKLVGISLFLCFFTILSTLSFKEDDIFCKAIKVNQYGTSALLF
jgi:hypothetical protein